MPFGPLLAWKRGDLYGAGQRLMLAFGLAVIAALATAYIATGAPVLAAIGAGLAVWVMVGAIVDLWGKSGIGKGGSVLTRLAGLPRSFYGTALGHFGIGVMTLGIVFVTVFGTEQVLVMKKGDEVQAARYTLAFDGLGERRVANYEEEFGTFRLLDGARTQLASIESSKRFYPARAMPTTEAGIETRGFSQVYVSLGEKSGDGIVVRIWYKPLVTLIWLGAVLMSLAAFISLTDRRLRVGAPQRAKRRREEYATG
jgi:cytochrome c-type biogenesis protein CcmF